MLKSVRTIKGVFYKKYMKKLLIGLRTSIRFIILLLVAASIIISLIVLIYKPIYSVYLDGEFIGYSENKSKLQNKISSYMENGEDENVAFVQFDKLPTYKICFLKKDIVTNDEEIFDKIKESGITYYKYYAVALDGEEKSYVSSFEDAENVVEELKKKNSANVDKLTIVEKYKTEKEEIEDTSTIVASLYKQKTVQKTQTAVATSANATSATAKVNIGINFIKPTTGAISSRYGSRWGRTHKGLDIAASTGTPIKAAASGTVTAAGWNNGGYGNLIVISHGNGVQTYYGHCSSISVKEGQKVSAGDVIGKVGSTGRSTGPHLHFEIRVNGTAYNPLNYVNM